MERELRQKKYLEIFERRGNRKYEDLNRVTLVEFLSFFILVQLVINFFNEIKELQKKSRIRLKFGFPLSTMEGKWDSLSLEGYRPWGSKSGRKFDHFLRTPLMDDPVEKQYRKFVNCNKYWSNLPQMIYSNNLV